MDTRCSNDSLSKTLNFSIESRLHSPASSYVCDVARSVHLNLHPPTVWLRSSPAWRPKITDLQTHLSWHGLLTLVFKRKFVILLPLKCGNCRLADVSIQSTTETEVSWLETHGFVISLKAFSLLFLCRGTRSQCVCVLVEWSIISFSFYSQHP